MNFQENVENQIANLKVIEKLFKPILDKGSIDSLIMNPKDTANVNLTLAYSLNSLYFIYLKLNGIDTTINPIMKEIERVQKQFQRYNKLTQDPQEVQDDKDRPRLDGAAAQRLIKGSAYNKTNSQDQKNYQKKQQTMIGEQDDYSRRFDLSTLEVTEKHSKQAEKPSNMNIWDDEPPVQKKFQKMNKGSLLAKTGHLDWKKEVENILK